MTSLHNIMIEEYKILTLYILKDIDIELRRLIWEKIFDNEDLVLINQEWYEIELHELDSDSNRLDIHDLEQDSD